MIVAMISLIIAIGGTAVALPGKHTVGQDDLKNGSVGARSVARTILGHSKVMSSSDLVAGDGIFAEAEGSNGI